MKRAVRRKRTSEQCERKSERTIEWCSTSVCILGCSGPQWNAISVACYAISVTCYAIRAVSYAISAMSCVISRTCCVISVARYAISMARCAISVAYYAISVARYAISVARYFKKADIWVLCCFLFQHSHFGLRFLT